MYAAEGLNPFWFCFEFSEDTWTFCDELNGLWGERAAAGCWQREKEATGRALGVAGK